MRPFLIAFSAFLLSGDFAGMAQVQQRALSTSDADQEAIRPKPARELKFQASKSAAKPDLVILEAGFDRTNPSKWIVKVANSGVADAGATLVNLNFRERRGDERSVPMRVPPLKAGAQATLAYQSDVRRPFLLS